MKLLRHELRFALLVLLMLAAAILACTRPGEDDVIYVTATFPGGERVLQFSPTPRSPTDTPINPTPNPTRDNISSQTSIDVPQVASASEVEIDGDTYTVRSGDTLAIIAAATGSTVEDLLSINNISNPDRITVGQVLTIPHPAPADNRQRW